ncbi:MAG: MATE family efflux transporter [Cognatishimia sp.]|uniref:MATE family efflux transporter n=1 Tax=Cognatishimia sp. TaxID=2211648 RepID=UPI004058E849
MAERGRFLQGSTMGHVVRMTLLGALGITFVFLVDLANLFWISQIGDEKLVAAVGFAYAVQFFSVSTGVGMMIATTAIVSRHIGRGDMERAREEATSAMILTCGFQALVALLIVVFRVPLLEMVGAKGETLALASRYLLFTIPSLVVMAIGLSGSAVLRAEGDGRRAMYVTVSGGILLMVIDPFLILTMGLGLDGAAIGIVLFRITLAIQALRYVVGVHGLLARPNLASLRRCSIPFFAVAGPALVTQMATPFGNYVLTSVIAPFGDSAVAGWAVVNRVMVVAFGGLFSLSGAIGGIFGQNYGAELWDRISSTYRDALVFCAIYASAAWIILALSAQLVVTGFGLTGEGASVYLAFGYIGAASFVLVGWLFVAISAFNNLGKPIWATSITWARDGLLILPAAWWLAQSFDAPGVIYGQAIVGILVGVLAAFWGWRFVQGLARTSSQS